MNTENQADLRGHVAALLQGGQAYETFESIVDEFAPAQRAAVPAGAERSAWQILEHLRRSLRDILDFSQNEDGGYQPLNWPEDYWPKSASPDNAHDWDDARAAFLADRAALERLVQDPKSDLFTPFPWGDGQTLLREALMAADHASYHLGQLVLVRRLLG